MQHRVRRQTQRHVPSHLRTHLRHHREIRSESKTRTRARLVRNVLRQCAERYEESVDNHWSGIIDWASLSRNLTERQKPNASNWKPETEC
jgi:hypothetical protein